MLYQLPSSGGDSFKVGRKYPVKAGNTFMASNLAWSLVIAGLPVIFISNKGIFLAL
jgi:hypothetical protein